MNRTRDNGHAADHGSADELNQSKRKVEKKSKADMAAVMDMTVVMAMVVMIVTGGMRGRVRSGHRLEFNRTPESGKRAIFH
jgi:hypothetical protein